MYIIYNQYFTLFYIYSYFKVLHIYISFVYKNKLKLFTKVIKILITFVSLMLTTMKERLLVFLKAKGLTQAKFADSINVARAAVSHIIAGRNLPSYEFLCNTMKVYPELNIEWLMLGIGEMYGNDSRTERNPEQQAELPRTRQEASRDFDESDLFSMGMNSFDSQEVEKSSSERHSIETENIPPVSQNNAPLSQNNASVPETSPQMQSVKQRKAVKIMVFFDDGTFQEF